MRCPRCDSDLSTYTLATADQTAIVCESCGFADISASHHNEASPPESWEFALARFNQHPDSNLGKPENTGRTPSVPIPERDEPTDRPEFSLEQAGVAVGVSLGSDVNKLRQDAADELNRVIDERETEQRRAVTAKCDESDENSQNTETEADKNGAETE
ncbi:hypothetical protein Har1130_16850 [Haloarcula sp. CBA1130]|uniref:hypothetical protein n=1 Tax=Haloarcula sp. CBA1129 TaxID=1853684 RepID=UPI001245C47C|nr:hypothetical protein [Haloarcula sp. CBA1129]KAA9395785.1 hypothetical protein Har1129_20290 [Haloarcula sp. CBA1129]KAA9396058.1 hypothetical protein Har1129_19390 [Haloarcula sp. CBA1129]KAA9400411.1 hypothetical protein Har1130_16850 [Haloarcula sp. CBA1130]